MGEVGADGVDLDVFRCLSELPHRCVSTLLTVVNIDELLVDVRAEISGVDHSGVVLARLVTNLL